MDGDLDGRRSWARLGRTLALAATGNVGMWAVVVALPGIEAEFGIDRAGASLAYTLTMTGFALGTLLIGRWVDRRGIAPILIAAATLMAVGFALAALSGSAAVVIALHAVIGFGSAASFGPLIADVSHWFLRRRGLAVAIAASGNYLAGAIWPTLLSGLAWDRAYLVLAVAVPLIVVPLALTLRARVSAAATEAAATAAATRAGRIPLSANALTVLLSLAGVGCCVAMSMPQVHIVALCVDRGYGAAAGAQMLSLMLMGGVASRLVAGALADRIGGLATLFIGSVLQCVALFFYLPAGGIVSLTLVSLGFGLAQGGIVPSYALIVRDYLPPRDAGTRTGIVIFATIAGMALGGWAAGAIHDLSGGYRLAFLNGIGWNVLNLAIVGAILLSARRGGARPAPA